MSRVTTKLNRAGMGQLLKSAEVRAGLRRHAEAGLAHAQANAPVVSGEYRDGLQIFDDTTDRAVVRYGSTSAHALEVEAQHGVLARSLDAAGGSV